MKPEYTLLAAQEAGLGFAILVFTLFNASFALSGDFFAIELGRTASW